MLFNSYVFLFAFLPAVLALWWLPVPQRVAVEGPRQRLGWDVYETRWLPLPTAARLLLLTLAGYVFYVSWDPYWGPRFAVLMLGTTLVDYAAGNAIDRTDDPGRKKLWLVLSLVYNLGMLGFFKYFDFFALSVNGAARALGAGPGFLPVLKLILPIGISFYMFESMTYTIDIYRGLAKPAGSLLHYALFISIFPKLIAGPIIRYTDVEEQYRALTPRIDWTMMQRGIQFFVFGLAKKLLIADLIAAQIDPLFAQVAQGRALGLEAGWAALLGYSFQIYFDFSAYSDMAVGLGFMLGFRFPQNFNRPYMATNISDFWSRWHMTLSRWLRDYLFIPLGGSRGGLAFTVRNLGLTMLLGGLWHGANWTFVLWGLYHGALLAGFHTLRAMMKDRAPSVPGWLSRPFVFLLVTLGWLLFRSPSLPAAALHLQSLVGLHAAGPLPPAVRLPDLWLLLAAAAALVVTLPEIWDLKLAPKRRWAIAFAVIAVACVCRLGSESPFLYFQF